MLRFLVTIIFSFSQLTYAQGFDFKTWVDAHLEELSGQVEESRMNYDGTLKFTNEYLNAREECKKFLSMDSDEKVALTHYTAMGYAFLNSSLRSCDPKQRTEVAIFALTLSRALSHLPNYKGRAYRVTERVDKPLSEYKAGDGFFSRSYVSTSAKKNWFESRSPSVKGDIKITIDVVNGKDISCFAIFPFEREVLLDRDSRFVIRRVSEKEMKLKQLPPDPKSAPTSQTFSPACLP